MIAVYMCVSMGSANVISSFIVASFAKRLATYGIYSQFGN